MQGRQLTDKRTFSPSLFLGVGCARRDATRRTRRIRNRRADRCRELRDSFPRRIIPFSVRSSRPSHFRVSSRLSCYSYLERIADARGDKRRNAIGKKIDLLHCRFENLTAKRKTASPIDIKIILSYNLTHTAG